MPPALDRYKERDENVHMSTYGRYPLAVAAASGSTITDVRGREFVDLLAGISVCNLGHCHPEVTAVIREQAGKLVHVSNLFYCAEQAEAAEKLLATCDLDRVFFCNSGAEANEGAIKLARRCMREVRNREAYEIITLTGSFHGRTLATLTATGQDFVKQGFDPLPQGFVHVPPEDMAALASAVSSRTAAILIEAVQGEGGVRPLSEPYCRGIADLCRETGILCILDEIQTGLGRTGTFWAHQALPLVPDIMTSAKALANGLPMGAILATSEVAKGFSPGSHGTTFGGGPLLSRVASTVVDILTRDRLPERAARLGSGLLSALRAVQAAHPGRIREVRGRGLMIGIEMEDDAVPLWRALLDKGFITNVSHGKVIRLLPPLTIEEKRLRAFVQAFDASLAQQGLS